MTPINEAIHYGRELFLAGINNGANGNISLVNKGQTLITRSGSVLSELKLKDFVKTTAANASSEKAAHHIIYKNDKTIKAVFHVHSSNAIALSLRKKTNYIEPVDLEGKYHFKRIPIIETHLLPGAAGLPEKLLANYRTGAVIVRGHGIFTFGKDVKECYLKACTIDNICKIILISGM